MTPETRTSLTTTAFVTVPVVIVAILAVAYVHRGGGAQGQQVVATSCDDLTGGTYWGLEFDNDSGNQNYVLGTIDLSSRGGLKHNIEVNWKTVQAGGASETTSEYDFDPASNCTPNRLTMLPQPEDNASSLTITFTGNGTIAAHSGNPSANWKGWITQIH